MIRNATGSSRGLWGVTALAGIIIATLLYLVPATVSGMSRSDMRLAGVRGYAIVHHEPMSEAVREVGRRFSNERGGVFPLRSLPLYAWTAISDPAVAHGVQVATVVGDLVIFVVLVALLAESWALGLVAGIATLVAMQLRVANDAVLGHSFQDAFVIECVLGSLLGYALYLRERKLAFFLLSLVLGGIAYLSSELGYLLAPALLSIWIASAYRKRGGFDTSLPIAAAGPLGAFAYGFVGAVSAPKSLLWLWHPTSRDVTTAIHQLFATLPTSYRASGILIKNGLVGEVDTRFQSIPPLGWLGAATVALVFVISLVSLHAFASDRMKKSRAGLGRLTPFALALWLAPALLHDPLRSRDVARWGDADGYVFVGYFGVGLVIALVVAAIIRYDPTTPRSHRILVPIVATLFAFITYGNVRANERTIVLSREGSELERLLTSAARDRLFDRISRDSIIVIDRDTSRGGFTTGAYLDLGYLVSAAAGRPIEIVDERQIASARRGIPARDVWIVRHGAPERLASAITLSKVVETTDRGVLVDRSVAYSDVPDKLRPPEYPSLSDPQLPGIKIVGVDKVASHLAVWIRRTCGAVSPDVAFRPSTPKLVYGRGFLPGAFFRYYQIAAASRLATTANGDQDWRYGTSGAVLHVVPSGCPNVSPEFSGEIATTQPARLHVRSGSTKLDVLVSQADTSIVLPLAAQSHASLDVIITTDSPAAKDERSYPPFDRKRFPPAQFVLSAAVLRDVPSARVSR